MKHIKLYEEFLNEDGTGQMVYDAAKERLNESGKSLISLLADASPEVKTLAAEIEKMLEPQRYKIGIAYYDKVMQNIAAIANTKSRR